MASSSASQQRATDRQSAVDSLRAFLEGRRAELRGALVFVDGAWLEILRWTVGWDFLLGDLAVGGLRLLGDAAAPSEQRSSSALTAVFLVCGFVCDRVAAIFAAMQALAGSGGKLTALVWCSLAENYELHFPLELRDSDDPVLETSPFVYYAELLKSQYRQFVASSGGAKLRTVRISYAPFFAHYFLPGALLLPACAAVSPLPHLQHRRDLYLLTHLLVSVCTSWKRRPRVYSVGRTAKFVAARIGNVPSPLASSPDSDSDEAVPSLALVIVDRALDLASVLSRDHSCLLDRVAARLPRAADQSTDVRVPLAPLLCDNSDSEQHGGVAHRNSSSEQHGGVAHPNSSRATALLDELGRQRASVARRLVMAELRSLLEAHGVTAPPDASLVALLHCCRGCPALLLGNDGGGVLQIAAAVALVTEDVDAGMEAWQQVLGIEKSLLASAADADTSATTLLPELRRVAAQPLPGSTDRYLDIAELLRLAAIAVLLCPRGHDKAEEALRAELRRALLSRPHQSADSLAWLQSHGLDGLHSVWRGDGDMATVQQTSLAVDQALARFFARLHALRDQAADCLPTLRPSLRPDGGVRSLLARLAGALFDASTPDVPDLSRPEDDSLGSRSLSLLTSGLGRWGFGQGLMPKQRRVTDDACIFVFVIGGVTYSEVQQAHDIHAKSSFAASHQLIVGSTQLIAEPFHFWNGDDDQIGGDLFDS